MKSLSYYLLALTFFCTNTQQCATSYFLTSEEKQAIEEQIERDDCLIKEHVYNKKYVSDTEKRFDEAKLRRNRDRSRAFQNLTKCMKKNKPKIMLDENSIKNDNAFVLKTANIVNEARENGSLPASDPCVKKAFLINKQRKLYRSNKNNQ